MYIYIYREIPQVWSYQLLTTPNIGIRRSYEHLNHAVSIASINPCNWLRCRYTYQRAFQWGGPEDLGMSHSHTHTYIDRYRV